MHTHRFIQALSHITLAPDKEVGDDHFFQTFGSSFQMKFPDAPNDHCYLKDLTIISQLFHSFAFTGKGTQTLLAKLTEPVETTFPTHVVIKDSWPTPAETHEAYLIKHVHECLRLAKDNQLGVAVTELKHLTLQSFPNVLHKYFCESVNPNTGELSHEATNIQRLSGCEKHSNAGCAIMGVLHMPLHNLEAHQFAAMDAQSLHGDITSFNQWMVMNNATAEDAVPEWTGNQPPTPRQAQLGDFGLAFKLLEDRTFIQPLSEVPATMTLITDGDSGGTGGLMKAANDKIGNIRKNTITLMLHRDPNNSDAYLYYT
ncbi:hypothetical protein M405DRAFT_870350 [Rhizopogon salebrosus TDB-379]|nr:hypothetical protein M405DRAFT_870350 [Rhizopogon salebrosus TDB-379]